MKPTKIIQTIPDRIIMPDGRVLVRKAKYTGKILVTTAEDNKKIANLEEELKRLELQAYELDRSLSFNKLYGDVEKRVIWLLNDTKNSISIVQDRIRKIKTDRLKKQNCEK